MANAANFVNDWYITAFNVTCTDTSGQTCEPYAANGNPSRNWLNWDYEVIVYQPNTSSSVQIAMYEFVTQSGTGSTTKVPIAVTGLIPGVDYQLITNCNGTGSQFCVILNRRLFTGITPANGATPPPPGNTWYINWIVASPAGNPQGQPINAPGQQGPNDQTFQFPAGSPGVPITAAFDQQWFAVQAWTQPSDPAAAFSGGEVINAP